MGSMSVGSEDDHLLIAHWNPDRHKDTGTNLLGEVESKSVTAGDCRAEHWIGGELVDADPVSNATYAHAARGSAADVDRAVAAARGAVPAWSRISDRERATVLNRIADAVEAAHDRLAAFESYDSGLPITQARGQARRAAENFHYFADVIVALGEEAFRQGSDASGAGRRTG